MIVQGNSLKILKGYPSNHFDSIVTDPPYGLSFMGKKWDYDVPSQELWEECLRVLKPGGYLLAFAGTRTQHRMAVRIEDAGFEIRDMIAWVYGSGFPKSLNIGKSIEAKELTGSSNKTAFKHLDGRKVKIALGYNKNNEEGDFRPNDYNGRETTTDHILHTENAKKWEGWGTALKPSLEPITVARKPISEKNIAENVLKWGTGGLNIDGSRVGFGDNEPDKKVGTDTLANGFSNGVVNFGINPKGKNIAMYKDGRFPANLIHDGSDEVVRLFPDTKSGGGKRRPNDWKTDVYSMSGGASDYEMEASQGSAARFFYCAKASKSERNKGLEGFNTRTVNDGRDTPIDNAYQRGETPRANIHPTVKPVALMRYLVKLVTPVNGTVLDPFNGSGTTGIACKLESFEYFGIEIDPEYVKISEARIKAWEEKQGKLL